MSTDAPVVTPVLTAPVTAGVVKAPKAEKEIKVPKNTIFQDAEGKVLMTRPTGRGRPASGPNISKDNDGNTIIKGCTLRTDGNIEVPVTPAAEKAAKIKAEKVDHFYILMKKNEDGTESEVSRTKIGRGKPKAGYVKNADGNRVMYEGAAKDSFKATVLKAPTEGEIAEEITENTSTAFINSVADVKPTESPDSAIVSPVVEPDPSIV